jgi:hypothetical protein
MSDGVELGTKGHTSCTERSSTHPTSYKAATVAPGGRYEKRCSIRATAYFCCSPGVSILAKNSRISCQQKATRVQEVQGSAGQRRGVWDGASCESAGGCRRAHENARGCQRVREGKESAGGVREGAGGCMRVQEECERVHESAGVREGARGCGRARRVQEGCERVREGKEGAGGPGGCERGARGCERVREGAKG